MKGHENLFHLFLEGRDKKFIIPVYQRNYSWTVDQCKTLFEDLIKINKYNLKSHFFGSIVYSDAKNGFSSNFLVIDGQQRITTISIFLLALHRLINEEKIIFEDKSLKERLMKDYLVNDYQDKSVWTKLKPINHDKEAYDKLINSEYDDLTLSNINTNYNYFYDQITKSGLTADELFQAYKSLQYINIFLEDNDNPQLIFESLNSTGLELTEGDKIRNFVLMGVTSAQEQERLYFDYWNKIEEDTNFDVTMFVRDYLSLKMLTTPAIKNVYVVFKNYVNRNNIATQELLIDLRNYSQHYSTLILKNKKIPKDIYRRLVRLDNLETTVIRPFLLNVLMNSELNNLEEFELSNQDIVDILQVLETYLFRRQIVGVPTNALNKIFVSLHRDIMKLDNTFDDYIDKLVYILINKTGSGLYPDDVTFIQAFKNKDVYAMSSKNKRYIFERFENQNYKETQDVVSKLENKELSIEHIMPQILTNEWKEQLGDNYEEMHAFWLHKLANLTLTGYNSEYGNKSFEIKKNNDKHGYRLSSLRMNTLVSSYDSWNEESLEDRNNKLMEDALKLWPQDTTTYEPEFNDENYVVLDEDFDGLGTKVYKISFLGEEYRVKSWREATAIILNKLYEINPQILIKYAITGESYGIPIHSVDSPSGKSVLSSHVIDDKILIDLHSNTQRKTIGIRKLLDEYEIDYSELAFYLNAKDDRATTPNSNTTI